MKEKKDALLFLDSFDENNLFDFEHNNKFCFLSEVLGSEMIRRTIKYDFKFCEEARLHLIDPKQNN